MNKTEKILKIPKTDVYSQYIAYHKGWGNYKNYKNNKKEIILAKRVTAQQKKNRKKIKKCQRKLKRKK